MGKFSIYLSRAPIVLTSAKLDKNDKRQSVRRAITQSVHMATGVGPPFKCTLKDMSRTGARIDVIDAASSPQDFLVLFNDRLHRWCRIMWRSKNEIAIKFVEAPQSLMTKKTPQ